MTKFDIHKSIENANPFDAPESLAKRPKKSQDKLFREITMDPKGSKKTSYIKKPWWSNLRVTMPAAVATIALIIGSVFVFNIYNSPSAYAQVKEGVTNADAATSGRIKLEMELFETPDTFPGNFNSVKIETRYDSKDNAYTFSDNTEGEIFEHLLVVDGVGYSQASRDLGKWVILPEEVVDIYKEGIFGKVTSESLNPAAVLTLIEQAKDFKKSNATNTSATYTATVKMASLLDIDPKELPGGLSLLAADYKPGEPITDIPEEIAVEITLTDELLSSVVVYIDGDSPEGYIKATLTTTYSGFGEPQNIVAPDSEDIVNESELYEEGLEEVDELHEEGLEELDELYKDAPQDVKDAFNLLETFNTEGKVPQECNEKLTSIPNSEKDIRNMETAYSDCLISNGHQDILDAQNLVVEWSMQNFEGAKLELPSE